MTDAFHGLTLAAAMSDGELSQKLGERISTQVDARLHEPGGRFALGSLGEVPAWKHTSHSFGFIPAGPSGTRAIQHVSEVKADLGLKDARLRISLDDLRVADYPGGGMHRVLFNFFVQNRTKTGLEDVNYNATYRIQEGDSAAVLNYPIFTGVAPQESGLVIRCFTVNVKNDNDEMFLDLLESDALRQGLKLAATAQPVLGPLSSLAVGMTRAIAARRRNVAVQDVYLGLDFGGSTTGARLSSGSYVAVQMPAAFQRAWRWSDWSYESDSGQILNTQGDLIPLNYFIIGISPTANV